MIVYEWDSLSFQVSCADSSSFSFLLFFCRKSAAFSMEEKTAFDSNELYSCHALQLKRIYISAFILLLAAISYYYC